MNYFNFNTGIFLERLIRSTKKHNPSGMSDLLLSPEFQLMAENIQSVPHSTQSSHSIHLIVLQSCSSSVYV